MQRPKTVADVRLMLKGQWPPAPPSEAEQGAPSVTSTTAEAEPKPPRRKRKR